MANRRPLVSLQSISAKACTRISTPSDTSFQDSHEMRINHRMKIKPAIMAPRKKKTGRLQLSQDSTYDGQPKAVDGNGKRPRIKRMRIRRVVHIRISRKDLNNHVHLANMCATRCWNFLRAWIIECRVLLYAHSSNNAFSDGQVEAMCIFDSENR